MSRSFSEFKVPKLWREHWMAGQISAYLAGMTTRVSRPLLAVSVGLIVCIVLIASALGLSSGPTRNTPAVNRPSDPADLRLLSQTQPSGLNEHADTASSGPDDALETNGDDEPSPLTDEELLNMEVNELGGVPIIMYHDIGDREGYLVRSRENFREDLQRFYDLGYCLIPLSDYLTGDIRLPAGKSPLVITFDDGRPSQLKLIEADVSLVSSHADGLQLDGSGDAQTSHRQIGADPDCAVGILLDFSRKHPGFGHAATFFVNYPRVFGTETRAREYMRYLLDNGMEIGNHTGSHRNLASASPDEVIEEIGSLAKGIHVALDYETLSLALPYGNYPKSKRYLLSGWWNDVYYRNLGVLLAGAEPAPSPFSPKFNPLAVPRIHGSDEELDKWLYCLERYPERRYTSDGRSDTVAVCLDYGMEVNVDRDSQPKVREFAAPPNTR